MPIEWFQNQELATKYLTLQVCGKKRSDTLTRGNKDYECCRKLTFKMRFFPITLFNHIKYLLWNCNHFWCWQRMSVVNKKNSTNTICSTKWLNIVKKTNYTVQWIMKLNYKYGRYNNNDIYIINLLPITRRILP